MKKLFIAIVMLVALQSIAMAAEDVNDSERYKYVSFRLMGNPEGVENRADFESWVGYGIDDSEVGIAMGWRTWPGAENETDVESAFSLGGFAMYHLPEVRTILEDLLWPTELLPSEIEAAPAIGLEVLYDLTGKGVRVSPVFELRIFKMFGVMYKYNIFNNETDEPDSSQVGLSMQWKF